MSGNTSLFCTVIKPKWIGTKGSNYDNTVLISLRRKVYLYD